jgi:hypothetical protein
VAAEEEGTDGCSEPVLVLELLLPGLKRTFSIILASFVSSIFDHYGE